MVINPLELEELRNKFSDKRIIFADGTFDLFHLGHVRSFRNLRTLGDIVVVAVLSDEWVKAKKGGKRPILSEEERVELVDSMRDVDYTILASKDGQRTPTSQLLKSLRPNIFVSIDPVWEDRRSEIEALGIELQIIPRVHESSTTNLIERIRKVWG